MCAVFFENHKNEMHILSTLLVFFSNCRNIDSKSGLHSQAGTNDATLSHGRTCNKLYPHQVLPLPFQPQGVVVRSPPTALSFS